MKRFDIITEADARLLPRGATVELARGGHITPLAADTLRDLRVTVVRADGLDDDLGGPGGIGASAGAGGGGGASLAPVADIKSIAVGSDHTGIALRKTLVGYLRGQGLAVREIGPGAASEPADYPDIAADVARPVARSEVDAGIVIDGAGLGSAIAANKIAGIRAAMCTTPTLARYAREHNGANVLTLGATLLSTDEAIAIVDIWRRTPMTEPRYMRRLAKIRRLEAGRTSS
jgi:ribose 5-phosphate isomerase B